MFGDFRHKSHSLGKVVSSPFSILVKVVDGKVTYPQFLEDSYGGSTTSLPPRSPAAAAGFATVEPFWTALEELQVPLYLHPRLPPPLGAGRPRSGRPPHLRGFEREACLPAIG